MKVTILSYRHVVKIRKKNPLDADTKVSVMRQMYPKHSEKIVNDPANRTIFDVLKKAHNDGYAGVRIIGGGDRVKEFERLSNDYNGKLYQFDTLEIKSAGDRDPDAEGTEGMSASKQRKAAAEGDFSSFRQGVPKSMDEKSAKELYKTLRSGVSGRLHLSLIGRIFEKTLLERRFIKLVIL